MKETDSIDDIAGRITELAMKMSALGSSVSSSVEVKKLLNSVLDRFLPIVASIEQYSDLESMAFEEAIGRLKAYEERLKPRESVKGQSSQNSQLLLNKTEPHDKARSESRQSSRGRGRFQFSNRSRGWGRGRFGSRGRGVSRFNDDYRREGNNEQNNGISTTARATT